MTAIDTMISFTELKKSFRSDDGKQSLKFA